MTIKIGDRVRDKAGRVGEVRRIDGSGSVVMCGVRFPEVAREYIAQGDLTVVTDTKKHDTKAPAGGSLPATGGAGEGVSEDKDEK